MRITNPHTAYSLQQEASTFLREQVHPYLDELWSELSPPGQHVIFDRLELDLPALKPSDLTGDLSPEMKNNLRRAVRDQLDRKSGLSAPEDERRQSSLTDDQYLLRLLDYFLAHGELPWWGTANSLPEMEEQLTARMKSDPAEWRSALSGIFDTAEKRARGISQLRDGVLFAMTGLFTGEPIEDMVRSLSQIAQQSDLIDSEEEETRRTIWNAWLPRLISSAGSGDKRQLIATGLNALAREEGVDYEAMIQSVASPPDASPVSDREIDKDVRGYLAAELSRIRNSRDIEDTDAKSRLMQEITRAQKNQVGTLIAHLSQLCQADTLLTLPAGKLDAFLWKSFREELQALKSEDEISHSYIQAVLTSLAKKENVPYDLLVHSLASTRVSGGQESDMLSSFLSDQADVPDVEDRDLQGEEQKVVASNAGVILLWPYLESFFGALELYQDDGFQSEEAHATAVLLIHYLATGETDIPEHELTLSKELCNWRNEGPLPRGLKLTDRMESESETLLKAVITNWSTLKNTSPDGLRSTFLRREGLLEIGEEKTNLQVERTGFDILLEKLPWSISIVKLPWMTKRIEVEW